MSNSPMVVYTKISPNHTEGRGGSKIDIITPHCVEGQISAEDLGDWFYQTSTHAASNYGIDKDGRVGMYVEEKDRSWCSSSSANDKRAVTIECASDKTDPYAFRDVVYSKLIDLCVEVCQRNGKDTLLWLKDKDTTLNYSPKSNEMLLTVHRWYSPKSCPGDWMMARMDDLASQVTKRLGGTPRNLRKGDQGEDVREMQKMLIACGYDCGDSGADGKFGPATDKAVRAMQSDAGLTVDGIYGPASRAALQKMYDARTGSGTQASTLYGLPEDQAIAKMAVLAQADQKVFNILASVTLSQFILETGYGQSELAQNANNMFGMKTELSGNTWSGSTWDGSSKYTKQTQEQRPDGSWETITADFRKYPCMEKSVSDHSAYLLGAKNGDKLRYDGIAGCTDYKRAVQILIDGGYATDQSYADQLISIIERWNLTQYDLPVEEEMYRVRKTWSDEASQKGAFHVLDNAIQCANENPGYSVYDSKGKSIYTSAKVPFEVRVDISNLNIRKGPGTDYARTGEFTGKGIFTIMEVRAGQGSTAGWGRLKSGAGWISLDFCVRL